MKPRRVIRVGLWTGLSLVLLLGAAAGVLWWYYHPNFTRTDGIVYTSRHGHRLSFDIFRPSAPNGMGVLVIVSGSWKSSPHGLAPFLVAPLLRRGYTLFAISHLSQPEASVTEIAEDMHRAARFVRFHAREYGIDPAHLGVTGGSAGGHLSLLLATRGGPGPAQAPDPVDRESSAVQAAAVFYPVTDLLNLGASTENPGNGGPPKSFVRAFGPDSTNLVTWKIVGHELSPIYYIHPQMPPILIMHGGADTLVPPDQSIRFANEARRLGDPIKLIIRPGKKHGWLLMVWDIRKFADWFDRYLRGLA